MTIPGIPINPLRQSDLDAALDAWVVTWDSIEASALPISRLPSVVARRDEANTFAQNVTVNGTLGATNLSASGNLGANDFFLSRHMFLQGGSGPRISNSGNTVQLRNNVNSADADLTLGALTASATLNVPNSGATNPAIQSSTWPSNKTGIAFGGSFNVSMISNGSVVADFGTFPVVYNSFGANDFFARSSGGLYWSANTNPWQTKDLSLTRSAAGVAQLGNGANNALGSLNLANIRAGGTIGFTDNHVMRQGTYNGEIGFGNSGSTFFYLNGNTQRNTVLSGGSFGWSSSASVLNGDSAIDTTISRSSSGVVQIGTTANNALGSLNLTNLTASGIVQAGVIRPFAAGLLEFRGVFGHTIASLGVGNGVNLFFASGAEFGWSDAKLLRVSAGTVGVYQTDGTTLGTMQAGRINFSASGVDTFIQHTATNQLSLGVNNGARLRLGTDGVRLMDTGGDFGWVDAGLNRPATKTLQTRVFESSLSAWQEAQRSQASPSGVLWSVFGATPVGQSTGWAMANYTTQKTLDPTVNNFADLVNYVCTLGQRLKDLGLIG